MTYRFIYSNVEKNRIIPSVLIDSRATIPAIKNEIGVVIKAYTDAQAALVTNDTPLYKIETEKGSCAGYFALQIGLLGSASIFMYQLRPAFVVSNSQISAEISNFITTRGYVPDILL